MTNIKYGQIGVGHAHASKYSTYVASDDYEVVGIAEPDPRLRAAAEKLSAYRDANWMSVEQLLNVPGLQVVGVETRVEDLLDTAELCVTAGKHIHLDKPAGTSLPQFKSILDTAASQHLAVQMGYMYRYNPAVVQLRQFLKNGWLGEPFEVNTVMSKLVNADARKALAKFSGGTMFELGCHLIDLVIGVLGTPENVIAYPKHSSAIDDSLMDNMLAVFDYSQATAIVRSSVNEVDGGARRHFTLCGSEGTFHIQPLDSPSSRVTFLKPHGKYPKGYQTLTYPKYARYIDDAADLAKIVRQEKVADFSYDHDYAVQRAVLLASGMPVE